MSLTRLVLIAASVYLFAAAPAVAAPTLVTQWGTPGTGTGQFENFNDLAVGAGGQVYVTDNHRVQRFDANGTFLSTWGIFGTAVGQFSTPHGVATDAAGNVYVADRGNHRVQKFGPDGSFQRMWGWNVQSGTGDTFQVCTAPPCFIGRAGSGAGQFFSPEGIAVDSAGNVYVSEFANNRVQKFTSDGAMTGVSWGSVGTADGQFQRPTALAVDAAGSVYVADRDNSRIQKFSPSGAFLGKWGGPGTADGQLSDPAGRGGRPGRQRIRRGHLQPPPAALQQRRDVHLQADHARPGHHDVQPRRDCLRAGRGLLPVGQRGRRGAGAACA